MADAPSTSPGRTDLSKRIGEITQRWLPMMLWRVGVGTAQTARLRAPVDGDQGLRDRLDFARGAVMFASAEQPDADLASADLARSVIEIAADLRVALDLGDRDPEAAQLRVDAVNRRLITLIVGAPTSPPTRRWNQRESRPNRRARAAQSRWWSRLISRGSAVPGSAQS